ncbi:nucleotidyltransferase family protein [Ramlibacter sp. MMS24-I3-19]|uniref:nucleotidyltransferase family protein n=1 Tax=Ramlibacter sp. MMS24-I3-19 TaxID=3416606 RepID=UPI003CFEACBB
MPSLTAAQAAFVAQVLRNPANAALLDRWPAFDLPDAWLVAGCLFQAVWNLRGGRPVQEGIKDYDLFYFDPDDLSEAGERAVQAKVDAHIEGLGITVEAKNQARVHLWYQDFFGHPYPALRDSRDGIDRFLVRETCVGIRPTAAGWDVHAPQGVEAIAAGTLSRNPLTPHAALFDAKAASYRARWPWLRIVG